IGDRVKGDAASAQGSEKGTGHEQPKRVRPHGIAACPTAFESCFLPFLFERQRTVRLKPGRHPIGSQAEIFRLSPQENRARYHHQNPTQNPKQKKSAAPAVMSEKELEDER